MGIDLSKLNDSYTLPEYSDDNIVQQSKNIIINSDQLIMSDEKALKTISEVQNKEELVKVALKNEEDAVNLCEQINLAVEEAYLIANQVINASSESKEVQQQLIDNANNMNEKANIAKIELLKASNERINAEKNAEIAIQQAICAKNLTKINNDLDISTIIPIIKIENKTNKNKFKLIDSFPLKCPDGFIQNNNQCNRFIEISNTQFEENQTEGFKNTKESNNVLIFLIIILILILFFRNKN